MISVSVSSVDGAFKSKQCVSLSEARKFAVYYVGDRPDIGSSYAVSEDGICVVRVTGCSLEELFSGDVKPAKPYQIFAEDVDEETGRVSSYCVEEFDTFEEAEKVYQSAKYYIHDSTKLVGVTDEAKAEIEAYRKAKVAEFYTKSEDDDFFF